MVNTNFFALAPDSFFTGNVYFTACSHIEGLLVSKRVTYSPSDDYHDSLIFLTPAGFQTFRVKAKIIARSELSTYRDYILHAASGMRLLQDGNIPDFEPGRGDPNRLVARTAIGLTADQSQLIVVVVQPGKGTQKGSRLTTFAAYLKQLGAHNAINFDGGGSSSFIYDDGNGTIKISLPGDDISREWVFQKSYRPVPAVIGFQ